MTFVKPTVMEAICHQIVSSKQTKYTPKELLTIVRDYIKQDNAVMQSDSHIIPMLCNALSMLMQKSVIRPMKGGQYVDSLLPNAQNFYEWSVFHVMEREKWRCNSFLNRIKQNDGKSESKEEFFRPVSDEVQ